MNYGVNLTVAWLMFVEVFEELFSLRGINFSEDVYKEVVDKIKEE